jgi:NADH-quinone oxidoreductase subunit L
VIGGFTALFAATIAVAQNDIKRVLAYSTISQLGYMIAALGVGAYVAAAFHLLTHAFFKALLFLGSGSVIHGMEHGVLHTGEHVDPQDMRNMGGLKEKMPVTFWTFTIGGLALSGLPVVTAGFWSKDEILAGAFNSGHHLVIFIVLATFCAADCLLHRPPDHADLPGQAAHRGGQPRPRNPAHHDDSADCAGGLCGGGRLGRHSAYLPGAWDFVPNLFEEFVGSMVHGEGHARRRGGQLHSPAGFDAGLAGRAGAGLPGLPRLQHPPKLPIRSAAPGLLLELAAEPLWYRPVLQRVFIRAVALAF